MTKPFGSQSNQLSSNDLLGRFAFLNELPPDVLKKLLDLAWHFKTGVQVDGSATLAASLAVANQAYVQQVLNGSNTIDVTDGEVIVVSAETLATRTLVLQGTMSKSAQITLSIPGQWFVINRCTGGSVSLVGANAQNSVPLAAGESISIYADTTGVSMLSPLLGSFLTNGQGRLINVRSFLTAGIYKYVPTPGTRMILVSGAGAGASSAGLPLCPAGYVAVAQAGSPGAKAFAQFTGGFAGAIITVGQGGQMVAANDNGQNGVDGGTSSFGNLLTIPGGKAGTFAITDGSATAYLGLGAPAPTGSNIIAMSYGLVASAAFVNTAGLFGGIECHTTGLEGYLNGVGGMGQISASGNGSASTPTDAGNDGGFIIYEMT
jgi:hypothetical protein